MKDEISFLEKCNNHLNLRWKLICKKFEKSATNEPLSSSYFDLKELVVDCLTSNTKTYHYVLPTQLLSKCVNSSLDSHSIQASYNKSGAFDARTIAHGIIVPFDKANYNVLGGSTEPYVNNPLRCPAVTTEYREQQKNKQDWDKLIQILDIVERKNNKKFTTNLFDQILFEIYKLLADVRVVYATPNRISIDQTIKLLSNFISEKSGGDRIEAVCTALFQTIAEYFDFFDEVRREKVNASDTSSGMIADIECRLKGRIVLLVEVKDRSLTLTQLDSKLDIARSQKISEILFLAEQGLEKKDVKQAKERIKNEFTSGQNIYISNIIDYSSGILILLGENGRVVFLGKVGPELDRVNSAINHRRAWANLLKNV